jgi:type VI secretion system protein ImpL
MGPRHPGGRLAVGRLAPDLSRTLLQLNADARFRARAPSREAVDPEWYRRKALALLASTERIQHDAAWTAFLPGSWMVFDNLEEQVQVRLEREFSDIVVETLRREIYARASQVTGVPLVRGWKRPALGAECRSPVPQNLERRLGTNPEDLPEFVAVADYVANMQKLDGAVQGFLSLQYTGGQPEQLRALVSYTLGKQLPGALEGAVRMFQGGDEVSVQPALMQSRLQWATRCSLLKAMGALHTRLLNTNDLFALEQGLRERSNGLFAVGGRPVPFDRTLERYKAVSALLEDQHALLAKGRNDWMRQGKLQLGGAYRDVMRRIESIHLFGPETVLQLQDQSGAAFAGSAASSAGLRQPRRAASCGWGRARFGRPPSGPARRRSVRAAADLVHMRAAPQPRTRQNRTRTIAIPARCPRCCRERAHWRERRHQAVDSILPLFPPQAQPVSRIDTRVSNWVPARYRTLKASLPADARGRGQLPPAARQAAALQAVLRNRPRLGDRLVATLDGELLRRLARPAGGLAPPAGGGRPPGRLQRWQGDPLPLARPWARARRAALLQPHGDPPGPAGAAGAPLVGWAVRAWHTIPARRAGCSCRRSWNATSPAPATAACCGSNASSPAWVRTCVLGTAPSGWPPTPPPPMART